MNDADAVIAQLNDTMVIVTAAAGNDKAGCLVGFSSQVSIDPLRYLVALSVRNHTYGVASRAERLGVHVLDAADSALAQLFGSETGDEIDKFAHCRWQLVRDVPVLKGTVSWFTGRIAESTPFGDHVGFLLDVDPRPAHLASVIHPLRLNGVSGMEAGHRS